MNQRDLDQLAMLASRCGHDSIAAYALALYDALSWIANAESGVWGVRAREALYGRGARPVDHASRAVAAKRHGELDVHLADALDADA